MGDARETMRNAPDSPSEPQANGNGAGEYAEQAEQHKQAVAAARDRVREAAAAALAAMDWVAVVPMADPARADALVAELDAPWRPAAHAVRDGWLVAATTGALVQATLARFDDPADSVYGTDACPEEGPNETVQLVRLQDSLPMAEAFLEGYGEADPGGAALMNAGLARLRDLPPDTALNPFAVVWDLSPHRLAFRTRLDLTPWLTDDMPPGHESHLRLLPASTTAAFTLRVPKDSRDRLRDQWTESLPDEMKQRPGFAQQMGLVSLLTGILGDEVTLASANEDGGAPYLVLVAGLSDMPTTRALMQSMLGADTEVAAVHEGVEILKTEQVSIPGTEGVYYAFLETRLVAATDLEPLTALIGRAMNGEDGGFYRSLTPGLGPAQVKHVVLFARRPFVTGTLLPLLQGGGLMSLYEPAAVTLADLEQRVRGAQIQAGRHDTWSEIRAGLFLE
jgi:hypothetical protein